MKRIILLLAIVLIVQSAFCQVITVYYMNVPEGGGDRYVENEQYAKKLWQESVDNDEMLAWRLYEVEGATAEDDYQFVTMHVYESMKQWENQEFDEEAVKRILGEKSEEIMDEIMASRELLHRDLLAFTSGFLPKETEKYLFVAYMKAEDPDLYYEMEDEAYKPIAKVAIKEDQMESWVVWSLEKTGGTDNYTAMVFNGHSSKEQRETLDFRGCYDIMIKNKSESEIEALSTYYDNVQDIREMYKRQKWILLSSTDSSMK